MPKKLISWFTCKSNTLVFRVQLSQIHKCRVKYESVSVNAFPFSSLTMFALIRLYLKIFSDFPVWAYLFFSYLEYRFYFSTFSFYPVILRLSASSLHFVPKSLIYCIFSCSSLEFLYLLLSSVSSNVSLSIYDFLATPVSFPNDSFTAFRIMCLIFVHLSLILPPPLSPVSMSSSITVFWESFRVSLSCSFPVFNSSVLVTFLLSCT